MENSDPQCAACRCLAQTWREFAIKSYIPLLPPARC